MKTTKRLSILAGVAAAALGFGATGTAHATAPASVRTTPAPHAVAPAVPKGVRMPTATPVGTFRLKNYGWGNYCLSITSTANGSRTALAQCANSGQAYLNQAWTVYPEGGDGESGTWYEAVNEASGLCLDGDANNLTGGAVVQTWYCNNHTNQRWGFAMNLNYTQHIVNLDAYEYQNNDRFLLDMSSNLQRLWSYSGSANQYWSWIA